MSLRLTVTFLLHYIVGASNADTTINIQTSSGINTTVQTSTSLQKGRCNDWQSFGTDCYSISKTFEYFSVAEQICQSHKAILASISNQQENDFLYGLIRKHTRYSEAWIGLKYNQKKHIYQWIDGSKLIFKNWVYKRPGPEGYCVEIIPGGKWNNLLCNHRLQFICKKSVAIPAKDNKELQVIILVSIPVSCVLLMSAFVAYLWVRSVHQLSRGQLDSDKTMVNASNNNNNNINDVVDMPSQPQDAESSLKRREAPSMEQLSLDAGKSDARDETAMQLYRKVSPEYEPTYTTVKCKDGIYRKVTLV